MRGFLSGGFWVADFCRYDGFVGTAYTASLTLLVRRPRTLIIPTGPAGVGKSTLASALGQNVRWWQRDAIFAAHRNQGIGLNKAKRQTHESLIKHLRDWTDGRPLYIDSTNGSEEARLLYSTESVAEWIIMVELRPRGEDPESFLMCRTENRLGDNAANHPSFPSTVIEQLQKHRNIVKGIAYPDTSKLHLSRHIHIDCDPLDCMAMDRLPFRVFATMVCNMDTVISKLR